MRVVVASCWKYRDTWKPFTDLFRKFWPNCQHYALILSDNIDERWSFLPAFDGLKINKANSHGFCDESWCSIVAYFAKCKPEGGSTDDPILLLQDDFFLNAPVNEDLIKHGLNILSRDNVGAVRLYPCPGGAETSDDPYFGRVERHTAYYVSCQATLWRQEYLHAIASRFNTPAEFELKGSPWASSHLPAEVWAFKRSIQPWPISYFCSAVTRGMWNPQALDFCKQHGIDVDTSLRPIRAA